jgi:hypothetical protein
VTAGDIVRYTSDGDALGTGIVLKVNWPCKSARVMWSGEVRFARLRWISFEYIEVIGESR